MFLGCQSPTTNQEHLLLYRKHVINAICEMVWIMRTFVVQIGGAVMHSSAEDGQCPGNQMRAVAKQRVFLQRAYPFLR